MKDNVILERDKTILSFKKAHDVEQQRLKKLLEEKEKELSKIKEQLEKVLEDTDQQIAKLLKYKASIEAKLTESHEHLDKIKQLEKAMSKLKKEQLN